MADQASNPGAFDVLGGHGNSNGKHPGNRLYKRLKEQNLMLFLQGGRSRERALQNIIEAVRSNGGRFFSSEKREDPWSEKTIREKVTQAMKYLVRKYKKKHPAFVERESMKPKKPEIPDTANLLAEALHVTRFRGDDDEDEGAFGAMVDETLHSPADTTEADPYGNATEPLTLPEHTGTEYFQAASTMGLEDDKTIATIKTAATTMTRLGQPLRRDHGISLDCGASATSNFVDTVSRVSRDDSFPLPLDDVSVALHQRTRTMNSEASTTSNLYPTGVSVASQSQHGHLYLFQPIAFSGPQHNDASSVSTPFPASDASTIQFAPPSCRTPEALSTNPEAVPGMNPPALPTQQLGDGTSLVGDPIKTTAVLPQHAGPQGLYHQQTLLSALQQNHRQQYPSSLSHSTNSYYQQNTPGLPEYPTAHSVSTGSQHSYHGNHHFPSTANPLSASAAEVTGGTSTTYPSMASTGQSSTPSVLDYSLLGHRSAPPPNETYDALMNANIQDIDIPTVPVAEVACVQNPRQDDDTFSTVTMETKTACGSVPAQQQHRTCPGCSKCGGCNGGGGGGGISIDGSVLRKFAMALFQASKDD